MIVMSRCHVRRGGTTRGSFRNKSLSTCLRCAVVLKCGQLASRGSASELCARIQLEMHPLRELGASVQQNQCNFFGNVPRMSKKLCRCPCFRHAASSSPRIRSRPSWFFNACLAGLSSHPRKWYRSYRFKKSGSEGQRLVRLFQRIELETFP